MRKTLISTLLGISLYSSEIATLNIHTSYAGFENNSNINHAVIGDKNKGVNLYVTALNTKGDAADEDTNNVSLDFNTSNVSSTIDDINITIGEFKVNRSTLNEGTHRAYIDYQNFVGYKSTDTITVTLGGVTATTTVSLKSKNAENLILRTYDTSINYLSENNKAINSIVSAGIDINTTQGGTWEGVNKNVKAGSTIPITVIATTNDNNFTSAPNLEAKSIKIYGYRTDTNESISSTPLTTLTMNNGIAKGTVTISNFYTSNNIVFTAEYDSQIKTQIPIDSDDLSAKTQTYDYAKLIPNTSYKLKACIPDTNFLTSCSEITSLALAKDINTTLRLMVTDTHDNLVSNYIGSYNLKTNFTGFKISPGDNIDLTSSLNEANITFTGTPYKDINLTFDSNVTTYSKSSATTFTYNNSGVSLSKTPSLTLKTFEGNRSTVSSLYDLNITAYAIETADYSEGNITSGSTIEYLFSGNAIKNSTVGTDLKIYSDNNKLLFGNSDSNLSSATSAISKSVDFGALTTRGDDKYIRFKVYGEGDASNIKFFLSGAKIDNTYSSAIADSASLKLDKNFKIIPSTSLSEGLYLDFNSTKLLDTSKKAIDFDRSLIDYSTNPVEISKEIIADSTTEYIVFDNIHEDLLIKDKGGNLISTSTTTDFVIQSEGYITPIQSGNSLKIKVSPDIGDAGEETITIKANGASALANTIKLKFNNIIKSKYPTKFYLTELSDSSTKNVANMEKIILLSTDYSNNEAIDYKLSLEEINFNGNVYLYELNQTTLSTDLEDKPYSSTYNGSTKNIKSFIVKADEEGTFKIKVVDSNSSVQRVSAGELTLNFVNDSYVNLSVSKSSINTIVDESDSFTISGGEGAYSVTSSDTSIVSLSVINNKVSIIPKQKGSVSITVRDKYSELTVNVNVDDRPYVDTPALLSGWNLVGNHSNNKIPKTLFGDSSTLWTYTDSWTKNPLEIESGQGFWLKMPSNFDGVSLKGVKGIKYISNPTKWSLLVSEKEQILTNILNENNASIVWTYQNTKWYGSKDNGSFLIEPGYGYWMYR